MLHSPTFPLHFSRAWYMYLQCILLHYTLHGCIHKHFVSVLKPMSSYVLEIEIKMLNCLFKVFSCHKLAISTHHTVSYIDTKPFLSCLSQLLRHQVLLINRNNKHLCMFFYFSYYHHYLVQILLITYQN